MITPSQHAAADTPSLSCLAIVGSEPCNQPKMLAAVLLSVLAELCISQQVFYSPPDLMCEQRSVCSPLGVTMQGEQHKTEPVSQRGRARLQLVVDQSHKKKRQGGSYFTNMKKKYKVREGYVFICDNRFTGCRMFNLIGLHNPFQSRWRQYHLIFVFSTL